MRAPKASAVVALGIALYAGCTRSTVIEQWPSRPVRVLVPYGAGTGTDIVARLLAPRLSERWRQPVIIDNRPGADGTVAISAFLESNDRHTLLFMTAGPLVLGPFRHDRLPYDPVHELVPIAAAVNPSIGIAVAKNVQATSLSDLVGLARQQPRTYLWAAVTGLPEILFRGFLELEKLEMKHVSYRDMSMARNDLDGGRIHVMVASVPTLSPSIEMGTARLLAVTTTARAAAAPEVPTAKEAGYPALAVDGKWGFFGRRDIPLSLREKIAADVRDAMNDAALAARLLAMGLTVAGGTAEEFARAVAEQRRQVADVARIVGLKQPTRQDGR
jgi:tripartite-type tricarboxylate transporter receptor subunit TctC